MPPRAKGLGSARALERLCEEHIAYQWIAGGVKVNYHTLADFRVMCEKELDDLLSQSVAALMSEGLVSLERTAQDGVRIRASAGSSSFRRQARLAGYLQVAQERVEQLKAEGQAERAEISQQAQAARQKVVRLRVERVQQALAEIEKINQSKTKNHKKKTKQKEARASTSDPEARVMKMGDGGFRPAYNGEFAVDVNSGIVVGVAATNLVDQGQMEPMLAQIEERYGQTPQEHLVDGGFVTVQDLEAAYQRQVKVYAPVPEAQAPLENAAEVQEAGPGVKTDGNECRRRRRKRSTPNGVPVVSGSMLRRVIVGCSSCRCEACRKSRVSRFGLRWSIIYGPAIDCGPPLRPQWPKKDRSRLKIQTRATLIQFDCFRNNGSDE